MKTATVLNLLALATLIGPSLDSAWGAYHSDADDILHFSLNAHQQVSRADGGSRVQSVPVGDKEILQVLGEALTNDLSGYRLETWSDYMAPDQVYLVSKEEGPSYNVTDFIKISWGAEMWNGSADQIWNGTGRGFGTMTISFNDGHGHSFVVTGLVTESGSSESSDLFTIHETNSWRVNAAGEGGWDGQPAVFHGVIRAHGEWDYSTSFFGFF